MKIQMVNVSMRMVQIVAIHLLFMKWAHRQTDRAIQCVGVPEFN